jgi:yecA family protein
VKTTSGNAPCPCGSGKKFKLCCMPREGASDQSENKRPPVEAASTAPTRAEAVRSEAFARLMSLSGRSETAALVDAAFDEIWGPEFRGRPQDEQDEALERPEAVAGVVTYCVLDAPAMRGKTLAEHYLAKHAKHVPPDEAAYLRRLATTRMCLYRIDDVRLDRGLRGLDLWTEKPIEIREKRLTHSAQVGTVIGARTFPAADGATELDGAIYLFSEPEAGAVVAALRAEWDDARQTDPKLDEQTFLKRRFPVLIHRFWVEHTFFGAEVRPAESFGVGMAEPHDRASELQYFRFDNPATAELAAYLHSPLAPTAMSIDQLHGFLCAVRCAPRPIRLQKWLPPIGGDEPMEYHSELHGESIIEAIFDLSDEIAQALSDGTFIPLLPSQPVAPSMANAAQRWCAGFLEGMTLQQRSLDKLLNDVSAYESIMPILALIDPDELLEGDGPHPNLSAKFIAMLPVAVASIREYLDAAEQKRIAARSRRALATRGAPAPPARNDVKSVRPTVHRLKITLDGIRPAIWRRVDVASDAKLPFVSQVLITAMGWNDTHLHAFRSGSITYGEPDPDFPTGMRSERSITLAQLAPAANDRFSFDYDFGDGWEHSVVVESIDVADAGATPRCVGGERACPPDDCGGVSGYRDLCRILRNPRHREYAAMRRWAGDAFDPEAFDIEGVNINLRQLARGRRSGVSS